MSVFSIIFYLLSGMILLTTGMAITRRNQVHSAIYLILSFVGTALLFYLLGAPLLAALEVIIYAGAIMVLFLFIIMTLRTKEPHMEGFSLRAWALPILLGTVSLVLGGILLFSGPATGTVLSAAMVSPGEFGRFLFERYWLAVEIVSFLLFVGLVGALYIGKQEKERA